MSPGGHLVTTAAACIAWGTLTESLPLTAGIALGGFLIDVDHAVDYVLVERQRDLRPSAFLRYYLGGRVRRAVLVLHSYELFALLLAAAWWTDALLLWGYLFGGLMHLALDVIFNGELTPRSIGPFYSFTYRLLHRFDTVTLFGPEPDRVVPAGFWRAFFAGAELAPATAPAPVFPTAGKNLDSLRSQLP
jgi:hypothetical protein